ncbi:rhodanese-like domain-containing protein [Haloplanus pelagicus]|jgi:rhodanese-related sulfurtransferase|uniref:rhodanese-like domain-containing protein n=1 Tax=Haloplanus pelagicus TaxID=2949995 RepID=UPI00203AA9C0|nr:rhodanese-like domain-containing protein [Haloplanus sp. HW8-1]
MDGEIAPDELRDLLESDDRLRVIDIRSPRKFARGHVPGSENVPFRELPDRVEEFAGADRIVTVCPHGNASVQAARFVADAGASDARVESMAGGLEAWDGPLDAGGANGTVAGGEAETPDSPF